MGIRSTVFAGPTQLMAMGHPFVGTTPPAAMGVPFAIDVRTRELVYFDAWLLKNLGVIHSAFGLVIAPKGYGKSSTLKILAIRMMMIAAGYDMLRMSINDHKPEGSSSEYAKLGEVTRSTPYRINDMSVNVFDPRLFRRPDGSFNELGLLGIAQMICEYVLGDRLIGNFGVALRVCMYKMLQYDEAAWSPHLLMKLLLSMAQEDVDSYYRNLDGKIVAQLTQRGNTTAATKAMMQDQLTDVAGRTNNVPLADIQSAGFFVSTLLDTVLNGQYGHMFGNQHSLYDILTQRAVIKDWRDVPPEAETLLRSIETAIKTSAIESNRLDLLAHVELDDEKHKSMENPVYARSHSFFSEIARGTHVCNLSATHQLNSIRKGGNGSELHRLGETVIDNLGFVLIGQQPNKKEVLGELQDRYRLSTPDTRQLATLPKFTFGMKLGDQQKMRFIRVFATPSEMKILPTDSATDRMVDRPMVLSQENLAAFAAENGIKYLGVDDA